MYHSFHSLHADVGQRRAYLHREQVQACLRLRDQKKYFIHVCVHSTFLAPLSFRWAFLRASVFCEGRPSGISTLINLYTMLEN